MKHLELSCIESASENFPSLEEVSTLIKNLEKAQETLSSAEYAKLPEVETAKKWLQDIKGGKVGELQIFKDRDTLDGLDTVFNMFFGPSLPWIGVKEGTYIKKLEGYRTRVISWLDERLEIMVKKGEVSEAHADRVLARTFVLLSRQSDIHRSPPLPLLCASMMAAINQMFLRTPLAQQEVSLFALFPNVFH